MNAFATGAFAHSIVKMIFSHVPLNRYLSGQVLAKSTPSDYRGVHEREDTYYNERYPLIRPNFWVANGDQIGRMAGIATTGTWMCGKGTYEI
jgi:hypothetical protein